MATVSLKQMAETKQDGIQKATYFKVRPDVVEFEAGFNLRDEGPELDAHIDRLYEAMKAGAYVPPIDVSVIEGRIVARDWHCRTRAARRLCAEGNDYMLEARQLRGNDAEAVFHMLGSGSGLTYSPLQQARGYLRLLNMGHNIPAIAARLGVSRTTIENGLALAETPAAVQNMVAAGQVSATLALKTVRAGDTAKLTEAVKASGKAKVTAKHIGAAKPRKLDENAVRELLRVLAGMVQPFGATQVQGLVMTARNILGE